MAQHWSYSRPTAIPTPSYALSLNMAGAHGRRPFATSRMRPSGFIASGDPPGNLMIVLYNPPSNTARKPVLPMSLLALGALLEGGHDYRIVDGNLEVDPVTTLDRALTETGADLLAVTVMPGPQLSHAVPHTRA